MKDRQGLIENTMALLSVIGLLVFLCSKAKAADETEHYGNFFTSQPKLEYVFDAALLADMLTTNDIHYFPANKMVEYNPLLGSRPGPGAVAAYGLTAAALHAAITYELVSQNAPSQLITVWEALSIGVEAGFVAHNYSVGLRVKF